MFSKTVTTKTIDDQYRVYSVTFRIFGIPLYTRETLNIGAA